MYDGTATWLEGELYSLFGIDFLPPYGDMGGSEDFGIILVDDGLIGTTFREEIQGNRLHIRLVVAHHGQVIVISLASKDDDALGRLSLQHPCA